MPSLDMRIRNTNKEFYCQEVYHSHFFIFVLSKTNCVGMVKLNNNLCHNYLAIPNNCIHTL